METSKGKKYCEFHKWQWTHVTSQCKVLKRKERQNLANNVNLPQQESQDPSLSRVFQDPSLSRALQDPSLSRAFWGTQQVDFTDELPDLTQQASPTDWMLDSGASKHFTPFRSIFVSFKEHRREMRTATNGTYFTEGYGDVILVTGPESNQSRFILQEVWLVPQLKNNLISTIQLEKSGHQIAFKGGKSTISDKSGKIVMKAERHGARAHHWVTSFADTLPAMTTLQSSEKATLSINPIIGPNPHPLLLQAMAKMDAPITIDLAHRRACYAGEDQVRKMEQSATGINLKKGIPIRKEHQIQEKHQIRTYPGDLIHINICGPISIPGHGGETMFMTLTDDASRYTWVSLLKHENEAIDVIKGAEAYFEDQLGLKIKRIHGDVTYPAIAQYCRERDIIWDSTTPYNKQDLHLIEPLVAIMVENQLPKQLWSSLIQGVSHTMNRLYHSEIQITPYEALYGKKPSIGHLRALGCQCWYLIPKELRKTQLDSHMHEGRLVGYDGDNYVIYGVRDQMIYRSRNVTFNEDPSPKVLPEPSYKLDLPGSAEIGGQRDSKIDITRYVPVDFIPTRTSDQPLLPIREKLSHPLAESSSESSKPSIPNPSNPSDPISEPQIPDLTAVDRVEPHRRVVNGGSLGRQVEAQREEFGDHSGGDLQAPVEPQHPTQEVGSPGSQDTPEPAAAPAPKTVQFTDHADYKATSKSKPKEEGDADSHNMRESIQKVDLDPEEQPTAAAPASKTARSNIRSNNQSSIQSYVKPQVVIPLLSEEPTYDVDYKARPIPKKEGGTALRKMHESLQKSDPDSDEQFVANSMVEIIDPDPDPVAATMEVLQSAPSIDPDITSLYASNHEVTTTKDPSLFEDLKPRDHNAVDSNTKHQSTSPSYPGSAESSVLLGYCATQEAIWFLKILDDTNTRMNMKILPASNHGMGLHPNDGDDPGGQIM